MNVILPIFLIILAGAVINTIFHIDVKTLSKLQFYVLIPAMLFVKAYESELTGVLISSIALFTLLLILSLNLVSLAVSKIFKFSSSQSSVFINASSYFNCGNYSLPLMQLLFSDASAVAYQSLVLMVHNMTFFTLGIFTASSGSKKTKDALLYVLKMPLVYVLTIAFILKSSNMSIANYLWEPINIIANGYTAVALISLGAQLSETSFRKLDIRLYISTTIRLLVSPSLAYILTYLLGIGGLLARVLIIAAGAPTAVNVVLSSIELDNEPEFASQAIFTSTILSMITINLVIMAAFALIPV